MENKPCYRQLSGGEWAYCVDAHVCNGIENDPKVGLLAVLIGDMRRVADRGEGTALVQFDRLVRPGMIMTRHVFQGLRRPLRTDGNSDSDQNIFVYARKPSYDYSWNGIGKRVVQHMAPASKVFSVLVSPNIRHKEQFPEVSGWINTWTWIDEDPGLPEAPIGWVDRYEKKLWTRTGA
jgi:hypothetical protein